MGDCDGKPKPVRRTHDPNPHPGGARKHRTPGRGGRLRPKDNHAVTRIKDRGSKMEDRGLKITPPARSSILDPQPSILRILAPLCLKAVSAQTIAMKIIEFW